MIKSQFTLKQLEALVYVIDTGTFRKAAVSLGTTQPNISARIASLEEALGDVLLYRDAGSVRVTEKGQVILTHARRVLRVCEELLEVADRRDLIEERLRLGVTELVACTWLQKLMGAIKQAYPNLRIELEVNLAVDLEKMMRAGELDLAIISGPLRSPATNAQTVTRSNYVWVANADVAQGLPKNPTLMQILEVTAITHARQTQAVIALEAECDALDFPKDRVIHSSSLTACVPMALEGLGIALLPEELVEKDIGSGQLVVVNCGWVPKPLEFLACCNLDRAPNYVLRSRDLASQVVVKA